MTSSTPLSLDRARFNMIEQQVRPWEVLDPAVLELLDRVRRDQFVPPAQKALAYVDMELPLGHGADQVMLAPRVQARMVQDLALKATDKVLEIGTGSGYLTACLSRLARAVHSIDRHGDFIERARARLQAAGCTNASVEQADALSYQPGRQFDAVAVGGAVAELPQRFLDWVRPGGKLFVIRGQSPVQEAVLYTRADHGWAIESLFETDVPYLHGAEPVQRFAL